MLSIISLALVSQSAFAYPTIGTPTAPSPGGIILCDPATDPGCGGRVIVTSPSGGQIEPDPTRVDRECATFADFDTCMATPDTFGAYSPETGATYVFAFLRADRETLTYDQVLVGADLGGRLDFGSTVADLDGDGALDLVLGVPHDDTAGRDAGALYIFFGPTFHSEFRAERPDAVIYGSVEGGQLGLSVARMDGAEGFDGLRANGPREGQVYVIPADGSLPKQLSSEYLSK